MCHRISHQVSDAAILMVCVLVYGAGCEKSEFPTTYPVKGRVLLTGDQPLTGGVVEFECVAQTEFRGFSKIGNDGTFGPVVVYKSNGRETPGLTAGEYRVRVIPYKDEETRGKDPFPKRYQDFTASKLTVTVTASDNNFTVRLDSTKASAEKKDQ
jgi:hypothetical protein